MALLFVLLLALASMLVVTQAAHAITIPGCGTFVIVARDQAIFEAGPTLLTGHVLLTNPVGEVRIGAKVQIRGTVTAARIFVGTNAVVDRCAADVIAGPGTCLTVDPAGFNPPAACLAAWPPPPLVAPVIPVCVSTAPAVTVPAGATRTLAPGCYGAVRLNRDATLLLTAGVYVMRDVRQLAGSTLDGGGATLYLRGQYITEPGVTVADAELHIGQVGAAAQVWNGSVVDSVLIHSPFGNTHPHTGTQLRGATSIVAAAVEIEPIVNEPELCVCPDGFHWDDATSRKCVKD